MPNAAPLGGLAGRLPEDFALRAVFQFLDAVRATKNPTQLSSLEVWLSNAAGKVAAKNAMPVVATLAAAITGTTDATQLGVLGRTLLVVMKNLPAQDHPRAAGLLVQALRPDGDPDRWPVIEPALSSMAVQLDAKQSARVVRSLVASVKAPAASLPTPVMAPTGDVKIASNVAERELVSLSDEIKVTKKPEQLSRLGQALAAVAITIPPEKALGTFTSLVARLKDSPSNAQQSALLQAAVTVLDKVHDNEAPEAIATLTTRIKATANSDQLTQLGTALASVGERVSSDHAEAIAKSLALDIRSTTEVRQAAVLGRGLATVGKKIPAPAAERALQSIIDSTTERRDLDSALESGVATIADKVTDEQATRALALLITHVRVSAREDRSVLGTVMVEVAKKVPPEQAAPVAASVLASIRATDEPLKIADMAGVFIALVSRVKDNSVAESLLFQGMKDPALVDVLTSRADPQTGQLGKVLRDRAGTALASTGLWDLIAWAEKVPQYAPTR